jgi:thiosulfate reductase cytochrome b subunit
MKKKITFYTPYERGWHWVQAAAVIILLVTGFEISYATYFSVAGFKTAVDLHNTLGLVLAVNAFLALFYNLAAGLLKRYVPGFDDFFTMGFKHASFYLFGIFRGDPHPFDKTPEKRLLPLQKVSYFFVLNLLLPFMVITGLLKWSAELNPEIVNLFGGLNLLAPLHRFGAWLFAAFLVVHLYMITTGHTVFSNLLCMIRGYEYVDVPDGGETGTAPEKGAV